MDSDSSLLLPILCVLCKVTSKVTDEVTAGKQSHLGVNVVFSPTALQWELRQQLTLNDDDPELVKEPKLFKKLSIR